MKVEISIILHVFVLGNWVSGYPRSWSDCSKKRTIKVQLMLNPWYLQCKTHGMILPSAGSLEVTKKEKKKYAAVLNSHINREKT